MLMFALQKIRGGVTIKSVFDYIASIQISTHM